LKFFRLTLILILLFPAHLALAQDSENGTILTWIEDSISTPDRQIRITGIQGALSSSARIAEITISDADGVWLQILDAQIEWSRAALFRARLDITSLRAAEINLLRRPLPATTPPSPEAAAFALPDLPVDIQITEVLTPKINLGEDIIGLAATLSLRADFRLDTDGLAANLAATRLDGPGGDLALRLSYDRATTLFDLEATAAEPANGVVANALSIEGTPALQARLAGKGVLDDLAISLGVDVGAARLIEGNLTLARQALGRNIIANLNGDIAGLLPAAYRPFFAGDSTLSLSGLLRDTGGVTLSDLSVRTAELGITGQLDTTDDGFPRQANLTIAVGNAGSSRIQLPFGQDVTVTSARVNLQYGQSTDGSYTLSFAALDLRLPGYRIGKVAGDMQGMALNLDNPALRQLSGIITATTENLRPDSAATAAALGDQLALSAEWDWAAGGPLNLRRAAFETDLGSLRASGAFAGVSFTGYFTAGIAELAPFSALAGRDLAGGLSVTAAGTFPILGGQFDFTLSGNGQDLYLDQPQLDTLLLGASAISGQIRRDESGLHLNDASFTSDLGNLTVTASLSSETIALTGQAELTELAGFIPQLPGAASLTFTANGPQDAIDLSAGLQVASGLNATVQGQYGAAMNLTADFQGLPLSTAALVAPELGLGGLAAGRATVTGTLDAPNIAFTLSIEDLIAVELQSMALSPLNIRAQGQADFSALQFTTLEATGSDGLRLTLSGTIPFDLAALDLTTSFQNLPLVGAATFAPALGLDGLATGQASMTGALNDPAVTFALTLNNLIAAPIQTYGLPPLNIQTEGSASGTAVELSSLTATGSDGLSLSLAGTIPYDLAALNLAASFQNLPLAGAATFAPTLGLDGRAAGSVTLSGPLGDPAITFDLSLNNLIAAPIVTYGLPPLSVQTDGSASGTAVQIASLNATGGPDLSLELSGRIPFDLAALNISARGRAPLALTRQFLASSGIGLTGQATYEITIAGPATAPQLAGRINTTGASLSAPAQRLRLDNLALAATLSGQTITINQAEADVLGGGRITLAGTVGIGPGLPANLTTQLRNLAYSDGELFSVLLNADLALNGPLATFPTLSGQVDLLNAEIQVPSGSSAAAELPDITHINVPRPIRRTQQFAGVGPASQSGAAFNLGFDLAINAPGQIFVRGRGLDAELGGRLQLSGSMNDPAPTGQFSLLRGRMDLLGERIDFTEGSATLAGRLIPMLDLRAVSRSADLTINIQLVGPATAPEIILTSQPELPQDEILARLIFSRGLDSLSPFQIAQLAASVAELSGNSNGGLITTLRRAAGLDNLDIQSVDGDTSLTAGRYLRDNIYSEVELNTNGTTNLSVNIDIMDGLIGRAEVGSDGDTGLGIFFERDY